MITTLFSIGFEENMPLSKAARILTIIGCLVFSSLPANAAQCLSKKVDGPNGQRTTVQVLEPDGGLNKLVMEQGFVRGTCKKLSEQEQVYAQAMCEKIKTVPQAILDRIEANLGTSPEQLCSLIDEADARLTDVKPKQ